MCGTLLLYLPVWLSYYSDAVLVRQDQWSCKVPISRPRSGDVLFIHLISQDIGNVICLIVKCIFGINGVFIFSHLFDLSWCRYRAPVSTYLHTFCSMEYAWGSSQAYSYIRRGEPVHIVCLIRCVGSIFNHDAHWVESFGRPTWCKVNQCSI